MCALCYDEGEDVFDVVSEFVVGEFCVERWNEVGDDDGVNGRWKGEEVFEDGKGFDYEGRWGWVFEVGELGFEVEVDVGDDRGGKGRGLKEEGMEEG